MKKEIIVSCSGRRADIGKKIIYRVLPNSYVGVIGPFVFFDYSPPQLPDLSSKPGMRVHPHRGIAILTYTLQGTHVHFDSAGYYARVASGGVQWMKAGQGINHEEFHFPDTNTGSPMMHSFQFWINLPARHKREAADFRAVHPGNVPLKRLRFGAGWIKVIAGSYENVSADIPAYSEQFLFHLHLHPGSSFLFETSEFLDYGLFTVENDAMVNDLSFRAGQFIRFGRDNGPIKLGNLQSKSIDILIFGGGPYSEPIVADGPFVMNSQEEIEEAYRDFHEGKYGKIVYTEDFTAYPENHV